MKAVSGSHPASLIVGLCLAACSPAASPSVPVSTATPGGGAGPTASPIGLSPQLPDDALDREAFGWQMVAPELDPATSEVIGHWLMVGTLADQEPTWSAKLVESPWQFESLAEQPTVADGPSAGMVVYVADDGATSEIRAVGIDGRERPPVGTTPHVVFAARLAPDASSVYLVLLDRSSGRDLGVFALELSGDGSFDPLMPPASVDRTGAGTIRLVAVTRFVRTLRVSADGSLLARLACGEPFGRCILDVIGIPDGPMLTYDPPDGSGELTDIGDGYVLGSSTCPSEVEPCGVSAVWLSDRSVVELPGYPAVVDEARGLVLLQFPTPTVEARGFSLLDPSSGESRRVFSTDGDVRPVYAEGLLFEGVRMEVPPGWAPVWLSWPPNDQDYVRFAAAVRLRDGGWVPVELPALTVIGGGHD